MLFKNWKQEFKLVYQTALNIYTFTLYVHIFKNNYI